MKAPIKTMAVALLALAACDGNSYNPTQPQSPQAPVPAASSWIGDQILVSCSGGGCSRFNAGETFSGVRWAVERSGSSIDLYNLDADMAYRGTMDGRRFVASYPIVAWEYPDNSRIEGEFALDSNSFEATETFSWVSPDGATQAVWRWRVSRAE
jgi:hypothetical protein